ncbi:hypothetical protein OOT33_11350 [Sphingobium sp. DEHP117]|uniref:hypothetical protein n=1 Tax=Sphingobium sp. DEHP117 TaxID=2993436 RepID=UPI0027D6A827|nr:hypothetical protein [Sphingobium sp. DEHP117]MDQ4421022.1 hypothetical protein [Sphingobium sp. DEHP117]
MPSPHSSSSDLESSLRRFDAQLRASDSATQTLETWLATQSGNADVTLSAHVRAVVAPRVDLAVQRRLEVERWAEVSYRRVWLVWQGRVLSVAENWFVAARLGEGMAADLAGGATPFGAVIAPLAPTRETLAAEWLWAGKGDRLPTALLSHHALVRASDGAPLCEVREVYTRNILT